MREIEKVNAICNFLDTLVNLQITSKIDKVYVNETTGRVVVYYSEVSNES